MAMTLGQLVSEANKWVTRTYGELNCISIDYAFRIIYAEKSNSPSNVDLFLPSIRTPDTLVYGDLLLLTYCSHAEDLLLSEHENRDEVEREILSPAGVLNFWTDFQVVIENGKMLSYEITYQDSKEETHKIDLTKIHELQVEECHNLRLIWFDVDSSKEG